MPEGLIVLAAIVAAIAYVVASGLMTAHLGNEKGYSYGGFFALGFFFPIIGMLFAIGVSNKAASVPEERGGDGRTTKTTAVASTPTAEGHTRWIALLVILGVIAIVVWLIILFR